MPALSDTNPAAEIHEKAPAATPVVRTEHREGAVTLIIEQQTAKIPSPVFLTAALAAMGASLFFEWRNRRGDERRSRFIGMWPGPLLILGVYNKLVKTIGPH